MATAPFRVRAGLPLAALWLGVLAAGCASYGPPPVNGAERAFPHELAKINLPAYVIEPPDILSIDALRLVPLPPYHVEPLDLLLVRVTGLPDTSERIDGVYAVNPDGTIVLGTTYGAVNIDSMTLEQTRAAVEARLRQKGLIRPRAEVVLAQSQAVQQIHGEHLVRLDGTISLGIYGSVRVTGMTIDVARAAIENHLSAYLVRPKVAVDVIAYNSKVIYVVTDGAGYGQTVVKLPVTGNETVLDAISQVNGLAPQASKCRIWVARPNPDAPCAQVLPVDWNAIVEGGVTGTNYQLLPGDRIFIQSDSLVALSNVINKIVSPVERVLGVVLLGNTTFKSIEAPATGAGGVGTGF
jgi:polysaccharide export outer membrane protein